MAEPAKPDMMPLLRARTLEGQAYDALRDAICRGKLTPGTRISANQISSKFGSSRIPVIHALRRLASEGFVEINPQGRVTVTMLSQADIQERYRILTAMERLALEVAWPSLPRSVTVRVAMIHNEVQTKVPGQEDEQLDLAFHAALWEASGMPKLIAMIRILWDQGAYYRALLLRRSEWRPARLIEHAEIVDGLQASSLAETLAAISVHRERGMIRMLKIFEEA